MYSDINCPYCGEGQDINHDDGYGYEEDEVYTQECGHCEKTFTYTTSISFYYNPKKAPCQNKGVHKWKDIFGVPLEYFYGKQYCEYCDEKRTINDLRLGKWWRKLSSDI